MRLFRTIFLSGGIPVGLLVGLGTAFLGWRATAWLDFVATTLACAAVFALALWVVTSVMVSGAVNRRWLRLAVPLAAFIAGFGVLRLAQFVPHGKWHRLPEPPAQPRAFVGPTCLRMIGNDDGEMLVITLSDRYFAFHARSATWTAEPSISEDLLLRSSGCRPLDPRTRTPFKSGRILARHRVDLNGVDCGGRQHYVLMDDRSIWAWDTGNCALIVLMGGAFYTVALLMISLLMIVRLEERPANS